MSITDRKAKRPGFDLPTVDEDGAITTTNTDTKVTFVFREKVLGLALAGADTAGKIYRYTAQENDGQNIAMEPVFGESADNDDHDRDKDSDSEVGDPDVAYGYVVVQQVKPISEAAGLDIIKKGHALYTVQGHSVLNLSMHAIADLVERTERPLAIVFGPKPTPQELSAVNDLRSTDVDLVVQESGNTQAQP